MTPTAYRNNHYVPQWYQRRFIPADKGDRELFLLDLRPESFRDGRGVRHVRKALRRTGTRKCFAIDDLYTLRFGEHESRDLEKNFFGEVDERGKAAVEYFSEFDHPSVNHQAFEDLLTFMSTQKLRTPKGLDWLAGRLGAKSREEVLRALVNLRRIYGAIWAESIWQIIDASDSPTKFILSDHPVTVYNKSCAPGHPECKGAEDPDIRRFASHTLFPLSSDRLLVMTNRSWATNPHRPPLGVRPNPNLERGAMFDFMEIQTRRTLEEEDVLRINGVIKQRAYRYIAAGCEEWLYPEANGKLPWRSLGDDHLLMPDPRLLIPGAEIIVMYEGGGTSAMDSLGRLPHDPQYGLEASGGAEARAHREWSEEFEGLIGSDLRGHSLRH